MLLPTKIFLPKAITRMILLLAVAVVVIMENNFTIDYEVLTHLQKLIENNSLTLF